MGGESNMQNLSLILQLLFSLLFPKSVKMQTGGLIRGSRTREAGDSV